MLVICKKCEYIESIIQHKYKWSQIVQDRCSCGIHNNAHDIYIYYIHTSTIYTLFIPYYPISNSTNVLTYTTYIAECEFVPSLFSMYVHVLIVYVFLSKTNSLFIKSTYRKRRYVMCNVCMEIYILASISPFHSILIQRKHLVFSPR